MSKNFATSADYASAAAVPATAVPIALAVWVNLTAVSAGDRFLTLGASGGPNAYFTLCGDFTNGTHVSAVSSKTGQQAQVVSSTTLTLSAWQHVMAVFNSNADVRVYLNGSGKGSGTGVTPDTTVNTTYLSGRSDHNFALRGAGAHGCAFTRNTTDVEAAYLGGGGSPRALKALIDYWKVSASESPIADQVGSINLAVTGTTSGSGDPPIETFMTGTAVSAQSYTTGTAITAIDLTAGGALFDNVNSAHTATLKQLGTAVTAGTTAGAQTGVREIIASTLTGVTVGGYIKVTSGGTPTRVLATNATAVSILVDADQTFASGAQIYSLPVTALSIAGLSIASNSFSGTPVAAATYAGCFFRATNNTVGTCVADTNMFSITITASGGGGGGGGGLQLPAGVFSGGFVGG